MELRHIIGYQPEKCKSLKWSKQEGENVVIFTSGADRELELGAGSDEGELRKTAG